MSAPRRCEECGHREDQHDAGERCLWCACARFVELDPVADHSLRAQGWGGDHDPDCGRKVPRRPSLDELERKPDAGSWRGRKGY